jgi:hypothetical protein
MYLLGLLGATRSWSGTEHQRNGKTIERPAQQVPDNHAVRAEPEPSRSVAAVIDRFGEPGRVMGPTARCLSVATPAWFDRLCARLANPVQDQQLQIADREHPGLGEKSTSVIEIL